MARETGHTQKGVPFVIGGHQGRFAALASGTQQQQQQQQSTDFGSSHILKKK